MLSTGQIYCGHVAGRWVSDSLGSNSLYPGRCQLFASSSTITLVGHLTGGGWSANNGPYSTYLLTTDPCTTNVEDLCAPEKEDLCTASGTSMSDAQATCSAYSGNTNMYDECITDVCASGAIPPPGSPSPPDHIVDGDDINNGIRGTLPPVPPLLPPDPAPPPSPPPPSPPNQICYRLPRHPRRLPRHHLRLRRHHRPRRRLRPHYPRPRRRPRRLPHHRLPRHHQRQRHSQRSRSPRASIARPPPQ